MCMIQLPDESTNCHNNYVYYRQMHKTTEPELGTNNWRAFCHVGHSAHTSKGGALRTRRWVAREGRDLRKKGKIEHKTYNQQNLVNSLMEYL